MTKQTYRFVLVGCKGDMPYLQKVGLLKRSWNTALKRGTERTAPRGTCHLCLAGTKDLPCEDATLNPCWVPTIGIRVPWDVTPELIKHLPHDRSHPGSFFRPDIWHCLHLGIAKSFVSSVLQICLDVIPQSNNDLRFEWLTNHYTRWCRSEKRSCYIAKISAYLVSYGEKSGASGNWSKGSVSTNLMLWLVPLLSALPADQMGWLPRCLQGARDLNAAITLMYNSPLFLDSSDAKFIFKRGLSFVRLYCSLAREAFDQGRHWLFPLFPKVHAMFHFFLQMKMECEQCQMAQNPLSSSCQLDEDTVGKVSRVSRRVNVRLVAMRTLQRHLIASWKVWNNAGVLR